MVVLKAQESSGPQKEGCIFNFQNGNSLHTFMVTSHRMCLSVLAAYMPVYNLQAGRVYYTPGPELQIVVSWWVLRTEPGPSLRTVL